ncbi:hypothetical protein ACJZ2D_010853 [Fusarium nematophilum]
MLLFFLFATTTLAGQPSWQAQPAALSHHRPGGRRVSCLPAKWIRAKFRWGNSFHLNKTLDFTISSSPLVRIIISNTDSENPQLVQVYQFCYPIHPAHPGAQAKIQLYDQQYCVLHHKQPFRADLGQLLSTGSTKSYLRRRTPRYNQYFATPSLRAERATGFNALHLSLEVEGPCEGADEYTEVLRKLAKKHEPSYITIDDPKIRSRRRPHDLPFGYSVPRRASGFVSTLELDNLDIHAGEPQLRLPLRGGLDDVPLLRRAVKTLAGFEMSPTEPITYGMMAGMDQQDRRDVGTAAHH